MYSRYNITMENDKLKELLDLIEKTETEKAMKDPSNIKRGETHFSIKKFINLFNIRPGLKKVPTYVIFFNYMTKVPTDRKDKLKRKAFFLEFAKFFPKYRHGSQRFYLLDEGSFDLSREARKEAKIYNANFQIRSNAYKSRKKNEKDKKEENPTG